MTMGGEGQGDLLSADAGVCVQKCATKNSTQGRRVTNLIGMHTEIAFRLRLAEKGYYLSFIPALGDVGVDCVVLTTRGYRGIQIKTAETDRSSDGSSRKRIRHRLNLAERDAAYYRARGVDVFAVATGAGFYLVPMDAVSGSRLRLGQAYWEAWDVVLGEPVGVTPLSSSAPHGRQASGQQR